MPTQVLSFPQVSRAGHQQTLWRQLPATGSIDDLRLQSQAADAVHSDPTNAITFVVSVGDDVNGANAKEIQREQWVGGTFIPKGQSIAVARPVDVAFGPLEAYAGKFLQLAADFNQAMVIGATVTALP